ncbi:MAG: hypothetical protein KAI08_02975 [Bacteroidales bacterium]|nr:hypothetical protein [Bacteroidales bacterium]
MKHLIFIKRGIVLLLLFFLFDFLFSVLIFNDLKKPFKLDRDPEILINGSSMSGSGFNIWDIEERTSKDIATYIREGVSVMDRHAMIDHFFQMYPQGIETVIYEVNPVLLSGMKTAANVYTHFLPFMDDSTIDQYIKEKAPPREYYIHKYIRTTRFESRSFIGLVAGLIGFSGDVKTNSLDEGMLQPLIAEKGTEAIVINAENRAVFEKSMETISSHDANVILVMMPMHHVKLQTYKDEDYTRLCRYFEDYSASREDVSFLDMNQDSMVYDAGNFSDPLHFNAFGSKQITDIISVYLTENQASVKADI